MPESAGHWKQKFSRERSITGGAFQKATKKDHDMDRGEEIAVEMWV